MYVPYRGWQDTSTDRMAMVLGNNPECSPPRNVSSLTVTPVDTLRRTKNSSNNSLECVEVGKSEQERFYRGVGLGRINKSLTVDPLYRCGV